jgi:GDP-L-fucose synthase
MARYVTPTSRIYVAGHQGLVGSALTRVLAQHGCTKLITQTFTELDLRKQQAVYDFFEQERPELVFLAAAKVGGIQANVHYPADFIYDNIMIASNIINAAYHFKVTKLLFLGSSCIYPRTCQQPIKENYLLTGTLEPTNEPYALAKIAGLKLCQAYNRQYGTHFIACMPTNLYGPGDNFNQQTSHVIPALIRKFHEAKMNHDDQVVVWGSGAPYREFLFVDDLADALLFLMEHYDQHEPINVGFGTDLSIAQLAYLIKSVVGFKGTILFDNSKPDGTPRKFLDSTRLQELGWRPKISLEEGLHKTYAWFTSNE